MFFELFADTGAKEGGPELGGSLTKQTARVGSVGAIDNQRALGSAGAIA